MSPFARHACPRSRRSRRGAVPYALGALAILFACGWAGARSAGGVVALTWTGEDPGWMPGFAEHPPGVDREWRFMAGLREVPLPLESATRALFSAADNPAGGLVMYWKRPVTGLEPGARYEASIAVTFASDAPGGCATPAGAPGDDVTLLAGVARDEPAAVQDAHGWVRASFPSVAQLGPIATGRSACHERRFERRTLGTGAPLRLHAADDGTAWLVVGSASAYRGRTLIYVERVALRLRRLEGPGPHARAL